MSTCKLSASTIASYKFIINDKHEPNVPALNFGKFFPVGKWEPEPKNIWEWQH